MAQDDLLKIRLSAALKARLEEEAQRRGESLAVVVREALRQYLNEDGAPGHSGRATEDPPAKGYAGEKKKEEDSK